MKISIFACLLLTFQSASYLYAQEGTQHFVEPKGVYKEIADGLKGDNRIAILLSDSNNIARSKLVDSIELNANHFAPPVLYLLSNVLFLQQKYSEAMYWYYVAQLRARYDVNRCTDKTASASDYNEKFGLVINDYAFKHLDSLEKIIPRVIAYVRSSDELYDQRWINLDGMNAMEESLGDKPVNKPLSVDKRKWAAIKKKTIDSYYSDFKEALASYRKK